MMFGYLRLSDRVTDLVCVSLLLLLLELSIVCMQEISYELEIPIENGSLPLQVFVGYSSNPWGTSMMIHNTEQEREPEGRGGRGGGGGGEGGDDEEGEEGREGDEESENGTTQRPKRSALQLYNMVLCATNCNPLTYKGYGCYCGFLGSGYPVDPIDRCCKMHDWCYSAADCPMFLEYFIPYVWTCYRRRPLCAYGRHSCNQRLCECDRKLAECLRRYPCPRRKAVCTSSPWRLFQNLLML